jgi:predicted nucleic acid-binding protein
MKVVADTDIISTFAKVGRLDILNELFDEIVIPPSVRSELAQGRINFNPLKPTLTKLAAEEIKALKAADVRLGRGEKECVVIAKNRGIPLASNDRIVTLLCKQEDIGFFTLPRILRLAILERVITREEAKTLVKEIEHEERTVIKGKDEIIG